MTGLSFAAPGALALGALLALPLIAHLTLQTPRERQAFGAMLLLERVVKRLRRRRRVTDPLLLLLRLLAAAAVILAVAAPELQVRGDAPEFGGTGRVVLVVDTSMSMALAEGGSTLLERARADAASVVREVGDGALLGLVSFGDRAERATPTLTADHDRVLARLDRLTATPQSSNLQEALLEARLLLGGEPGEVLVFTDEAGADTVRGAKDEIARLIAAGSAVIPRPVHADPPRNLAVVEATYGEGIEGGHVRVRVESYGATSVEAACEVVLPDGRAVPVFVQVPAAGVTADGVPVPGLAEETITVPREAAGGVGKAWCEDEDLPLDDARYFHLPRVGASRVLVIDGDPGATPTRSEVYFLERALAPWGAAHGDVRPDVRPPAGLSRLDPEVHRVVFIANVADPRPYGGAIAEFVRRGGSVVISGGDNVAPDRYDAALAGLLPAPIRRAKSVAAAGEAGEALQLPDFDHPLFAPFLRTGRAGFGKVRATRVLTLDPYSDGPDVHTLLRFSGGLPALIERKVGSGRVLLWTGTFDLAWNNLPLQSVYMPLVQRLVGWLGGEAGGAVLRVDALVGEGVVLPLPDAAMDPQVIGPDGQPVHVEVGTTDVRFTPTAPGAYRLETPASPPLAFIAVNTRREESDVLRYASLATVEAAIAPELFVRRADLAPGLLGLAVALFGLQALFAARRTA